jgi:hypothetical protein
MSDTAKAVIEEYVKTAEAVLAKEFGSNVTPEMLEKFAMILIESDRQNALEKEAESVIYRSFADELKNQGIDPLPVLKGLAEVAE